MLKMLLSLVVLRGVDLHSPNSVLDAVLCGESVFSFLEDDLVPTVVLTRAGEWLANTADVTIGDPPVEETFTVNQLAVGYSWLFWLYVKAICRFSRQNPFFGHSLMQCMKLLAKNLLFASCLFDSASRCIIYVNANFYFLFFRYSPYAAQQFSIRLLLLLVLHTSGGSNLARCLACITLPSYSPVSFHQSSFYLSYMMLASASFPCICSGGCKLDSKFSPSWLNSGDGKIIFWSFQLSLICSFCLLLLMVVYKSGGFNIALNFVISCISLPSYSPFHIQEIRRGWFSVFIIDFKCISELVLVAVWFFWNVCFTASWRACFYALSWLCTRPYFNILNDFLLYSFSDLLLVVLDLLLVVGWYISWQFLSLFIVLIYFICISGWQQVVLALHVTVGGCASMLFSVSRKCISQAKNLHGTTSSKVITTSKLVWLVCWLRFS